MDIKPGSSKEYLTKKNREAFSAKYSAVSQEYFKILELVGKFIASNGPIHQVSLSYCFIGKPEIKPPYDYLYLYVTTIRPLTPHYLGMVKNSGALQTLLCNEGWFESRNESHFTLNIGI